MRLKDTKTVKAMIDRIRGGGGGTTTPAALVLKEQYSGESIPVTNDEDIDTLGTFYTNYQNGVELPTTLVMDFRTEQNVRRVLCYSIVQVIQQSETMFVVLATSTLPGGTTPSVTVVYDLETGWEITTTTGE